MDNQCQFRFYVDQLKDTQCNIIYNSQHKYCRFHGSVEQRYCQNMSVPRWALGIQPSQEDSLLTYQKYYSKIPDDNLEDYYDGDLSDLCCDKLYSKITPIQQYQLPTKLPQNGCRYQITIGKYMGYYCGHDIKVNTEMCIFHDSVIKWKQTHIWSNTKTLTPLWTKCIYPTKEDSQLSIVDFPYKHYDLHNLLFSELHPNDIDFWNKQEYKDPK